MLSASNGCAQDVHTGLNKTVTARGQSDCGSLFIEIAASQAVSLLLAMTLRQTAAVALLLRSDG